MRRSETSAGGFQVNEWLEALIRCRDEQPRRYAREVSAGTQVQVSRYEEQKREHAERNRAHNGRRAA